MVSVRKIARRTFLTAVVAAAGGLAVGYYYYQREPANPLLAGKSDRETIFNPFVKIDAAGKITVIAPRAEMGQGVSTTLAALVAEELDVPLSMITVEHGPASGAYRNQAMLAEGAPYPSFDEGFGATSMRSVMRIVGKFLSLQVTGGSSSTIDAFDKMRQAGAITRELLKTAAAKQLNVDANTLITSNAMVSDPASGKSLSYAALASAAALLSPPLNITLRDPATWKILGKSQSRVDMHAKVTGAPIFGIDVRLPDMVFATVRMNPRLRGDLISFDASAAKSIKGVLDVIEIRSQTGSGFAVIATNTWAAFKGADAVKVEWGPAPYAATSEEQRNILQHALATGKGSALRDIGDVTSVMAAANGNSRIEAEYYVPHLAHATMEPMNATAQFKDGVLDIWSPNQAPTVVQGICAGIAGVEISKVNVHTTHMGGGFGRRGEIDFSLYATMIAMKTNGRPVKVTWTREEDMTHDTYRPASVASFKATRDAEGYPVAFDARIAAPSIIKSVLARTYPSISPMGPDRSVVDGSFNQPYAIQNLRVTGIEPDINVPVGFWRSVGNSNNGFFHESFIDEMAHAAKIDPVTFRLKLMADYPVAHGTILKVAEMSNWTQPPATGHARGMAFTLAFGGWVAMVVEISSPPAGVKLEKVWCAADVGRVLDPNILKAQIISGAIYGLSSAMNQEITFADGMVEQKNFTDFDAMRIWQCPTFDVALLETAEHMGGAGEISTPPAAPALANAVFALTGKRIRQLPLSREVSFS
jgi:isoquinoline 1-oxidoreductase subunit beta